MPFRVCTFMRPLRVGIEVEGEQLALRVEDQDKNQSRVNQGNFGLVDVLFYRGADTCSREKAEVAACWDEVTAVWKDRPHRPSA